MDVLRPSVEIEKGCCWKEKKLRNKVVFKLIKGVQALTYVRKERFLNVIQIRPDNESDERAKDGDSSAESVCRWAQWMECCGGYKARWCPSRSIVDKPKRTGKTWEAPMVVSAC